MKNFLDPHLDKIRSALTAHYLIMYFELPTSMIQYKTNVFVRLIVPLLYEVYEIMKPSECPFFHIRFIVLFKHATCSLQFFVKTYQKSLRHRNFISLCDVKY